MKQLSGIFLNFTRSIVLTIIITGILCSNNYVLAQHEHSKHKEHSIIKENKTEKTNEESIVREGIINLKKIDKNKDGKVFQDQMDWNVISDKAGICPLCDMELVEVSLKKAKDNLTKNGFKVKSN